MLLTELPLLYKHHPTYQPVVTWSGSAGRRLDLQCYYLSTQAAGLTKRRPTGVSFNYPSPSWCELRQPLG